MTGRGQMRSMETSEKDVVIAHKRAMGPKLNQTVGRANEKKKSKSKLDRSKGLR